MHPILKSVVTVVLIILVVFVMLLIIEGTLRLVFGSPGRRSLQNSPYTLNQDYLVSMKPDFTDTFVRSKENGGDTIIWKTNSQGFRGGELSKNPDYRLLVYGDSNILARFSKDENTFVSQLQSFQNLLHPNKQVEVINAGLVGSGTDQAVIRMRKDLPILKPNLVILHIFASNDMGDVIRNRLFELDKDDNLVRTSFPVLPDPELRSQKGFKYFIQSTKLYSLAARINKYFTNDKSKNPTIFINEISAVNTSEFDVYQQHQPLKYSHFSDHYDLDVATNPKAISSKTKIKLLSKLLKEAQNICAENNTNLMVLIQPAVFDLCQNHLFGPKELSTYKDYKTDYLCRIIEQTCQDISIPTLNLYTLFSTLNPSELYFRINDDHWNDKGQKFAAQLMSDYIYKNNLLINN